MSGPATAGGGDRGEPSSDPSKRFRENPPDDAEVRRSRRSEPAASPRRTAPTAQRSTTPATGCRDREVDPASPRRGARARRPQPGVPGEPADDAEVRRSRRSANAASPRRTAPRAPRSTRRARAGRRGDFLHGGPPGRASSELEGSARSSRADIRSRARAAWRRTSGCSSSSRPARRRRARCRRRRRACAAPGRAPAAAGGRAARAAPGPASPSSRRVETLRHISAGRQCSSARPATTGPVASSVQTWSSPRAPQVRTQWSGQRRGVQPRRARLERQPREVGQLGDVVTPVGAARAGRGTAATVASTPEEGGQLLDQRSHRDVAVARRREVGIGAAHAAMMPNRTDAARRSSVPPMTTSDVARPCSTALARGPPRTPTSRPAPSWSVIAGVADGADAADLADRFAGTLEFGTAGLRGALGAGPEPDEPRRRHPRRRRPRGVPQGPRRRRRRPSS